MTRYITIAAALACVAGCATGGGTPHAVAPATKAQESALLDRVKQLEGTWEMKDEAGKTQVASVFSVGSGGSAVREVLFPGSPHEMTDMYHMDGPALVMTHYCAVGNQPRMRAVVGEAGVLDFKFDGVSNFTDAAKGYMGEMKLTIKDKDSIREEWKFFKDGKVDHATAFDMTRRK